MNNSPGTLELCALELSYALSSVKGLLAVDNITKLLGELGLSTPPDLTGDTIFIGNVTTAVEAVASLSTPVQAVISAIDADDITGLASATVNLISAI